MWEYFGHGSGKFESWKKIHTFDGAMTYYQISQSVNNYINADIPHPMRMCTRKLKTIWIFMIEIGNRHKSQIYSLISELYVFIMVQNF